MLALLFLPGTQELIHGLLFLSFTRMLFGFYFSWAVKRDIWSFTTRVYIALCEPPLIASKGNHKECILTALSYAPELEISAQMLFLVFLGKTVKSCCTTYFVIMMPW